MKIIDLQASSSFLLAFLIAVRSNKFIMTEWLIGTTGLFGKHLLRLNMKAIHPWREIEKSVLLVLGSLLLSLIILAGGVRPTLAQEPACDQNACIIWALNSRVPQAGYISVYLDRHRSIAGPYDIYLANNMGAYKVCAQVNTLPVVNSIEIGCFLAVPVGYYELYSTIADSTTRIATAPNGVEVYADPTLVFVDNGKRGNVAAVNSTINIYVSGYLPQDNPIEIYLFYNTNSRLITSTIAWPITWQIPADLGNPCSLRSDTPCIILARHISYPSIVASSKLFINQPQIMLKRVPARYTGGENISILLTGHTPDFEYDLKLSNGRSETWLGRTPVTNALGDTLNPVIWSIPADWPSGSYQITSHPAVGDLPRDPTTMTPVDQIAVLETVQIDLSPDYLPVTGQASPLD